MLLDKALDWRSLDGCLASHQASRSSQSQALSTRGNPDVGSRCHSAAAMAMKPSSHGFTTQDRAVISLQLKASLAPD